MQHKTLDSHFEIKSVSEKGAFSGYGSVFGNVDLHRDIILPGAFSKSLERHKQKGTMPSMLWQHKMADVVGIYTEMAEDDHGLKLSGELFVNENVPEADKAYTLMRRGAVKGLSIGFNIPKGGEEYDKDNDIWKIKEVDLVEVSIVTYPANQEAQIATVKSALESPRDFERFLRDAGLTRHQAKCLMAGGYGAMVESPDASDDGDTEAAKQIIQLLNKMRGAS